VSVRERALLVENDGSVTVGELRVRRKACSGKPKVNSYIGSVRARP